MMKCTVYTEGELIGCVHLFIKIVLVACLPCVTSHWAIAYTIDAVHLTSFGWQTNHQCMTIVNIHHITFTHAPAVLKANFCCYHEHYHVGAQPLLAMQQWRRGTRHMPTPHHPFPGPEKNVYKLGRQASHLCHKHIKIIPVKSLHSTQLHCTARWQLLLSSVRRLA